MHVVEVYLCIAAINGSRCICDPASTSRQRGHYTWHSILFAFNYPGLFVSNFTGKKTKCVMDTSRCLKLVLPFCDALELTRCEALSKAQRALIGSESSEEGGALWDALCKHYMAEPLETARGQKVEWPEQDGDTHKDWFSRLYEVYQICTKYNAVKCQECGELGATELDHFECEQCDGCWCNDCGQRGPSKRDVSCKECPDFSQTHCWECFAEGKTLRCECSGTDSWHSCCGRHAFNCPRCDTLVCEYCEERHGYDCKEVEEDEDEEDEEDEENEENAA